MQPTAATWQFPQVLPPLTLVVIVSGGQPGKIYSTKFRAFDARGVQRAEGNGPDVPFTTQIKSANLTWNLQQISAEPIVEEAGTYWFALLVDGEELTRTSLDIRQVARPPQAPPSGPQ